MKRMLLFIMCWMMLGCQADLEQASEVSKFRILAVQSDPPMAVADVPFALKGLFAVPKGNDATAVWMMPNFSAMIDAVLGGEIPADFSVDYVIEQVPIDAQGIADTGEVALSVSADVLSVFAALGMDSLPVYVLGCSNGTVNVDQLRDTLQNIDSTQQISNLEQACEGAAAERVVAFKLISLFPVTAHDGCGLESHASTNPEIVEVLMNDVPLWPGTKALDAPFQCEGSDGCREPVEIKVKTTPESFEYYCWYTGLKNELEANYISFFADAGEFGNSRIRSEDAQRAIAAGEKGYLDGDGNDILTDSWFAENPHYFNVQWVPPRKGGTVHMWMVAHDLRGGVSWQQYQFEVQAPE